MRMCLCVACCRGGAGRGVGRASARAQLYEDIGTRAQGMSGAFVAVADDATAVWWNPAGLATGAYFNAIVEKGPGDPTRKSRRHRSGASRNGDRFCNGAAVAGLQFLPPACQSNVRSDSTEPLLQSRQDDGGVAQVRSRALSQLGVTVDQIARDHLVVGSTLKIVRGGQGTAPLIPRQTFWIKATISTCRRRHMAIWIWV